MPSRAKRAHRIVAHQRPPATTPPKPGAATVAPRHPHPPSAPTRRPRPRTTSRAHGTPPPPTPRGKHAPHRHLGQRQPHPHLQQTRPLQHPTASRTRVQGDAHQGTTVKHRSRLAQDPTRPNLRQIHLISAELLDEFAAHGHHVQPGQLGENVTTRSLDLLSLSTGTVLGLGPHARIRVTGLRNPCVQIDGFSRGLLAHTVRRQDDGTITRRAGIMGTVLTSGTVEPGMDITVHPPQGPHLPLQRV
ncbi:MOSC domain-containing protein [Nocardiopsis sp. CNR-923]|uniref:MOSC domain-containing protein n=1 Tax=Nocardiopsis sp. CNR-923 TaxID=1904965 RepID=UPI000B0D8282|nr:MOSC domain-containing protein [Nocardiopsis sp. CNR-923]